jgi:RimJ/RimL family protein N-acetyltransferase
MSWAAEQNVDCLYFLADSGDASTVTFAETNGFNLVDLKVTKEKLLSPGSSLGSETEKRIRLVLPEDVSRLRCIAGVSHTDSRFYFDPHFSQEQCKALYETWIEKSCHGWADAVLVAERERSVVGYISCHRDAAETGRIGLLGVAAEARGEGLGLVLVQAALDWFKTQEISRVTVVTQGRNTAAQRLYERAGFVTRSVQLWYHRWKPLS